MNKHFKSAEEFDIYVKQYKPIEIWLDAFSLENPIFNYVIEKTTPLEVVIQINAF